MPKATAAVGPGATVALCVGCTANASFEGAAWQAVGPNICRWAGCTGCQPWDRYVKVGISYPIPTGRRSSFCQRAIFTAHSSSRCRCSSGIASIFG